MTCPSRPWPRQPSTPTGKWRRPCAAAIFARASPASWKSGRRDLPVSEQATARLLRVEARLRPSGYDVAAFATNGLAEPKLAQPAKAGGARRDRTADLVIANDALSQLSYGPMRPPRGCEGGHQSAHLQSAPTPSQERRIRRFPLYLAGTSLVCAGG